MNYHQAIKKYKNDDLIAQVEGGTKHDFIKIVLTELSLNLKILSNAIKNEPKTSKNKSKSLAKIIATLTILMNSLDFDKGEQIATNLFNLYDYCKRVVLDDYKNLKTNGISSAIQVIDDILSAWVQIK